MQRSRSFLALAVAVTAATLLALPRTAVARGDYDSLLFPTDKFQLMGGIDYTHITGDEPAQLLGKPVATSYSQGPVDLAFSMEYLEPYGAAGSRIPGFWSPPLGYQLWFTFGYMPDRSQETVPPTVTRSPLSTTTSARMAFGGGTLFQLVHSSNFYLGGRLAMEARVFDQNWYGESLLVGLGGFETAVGGSVTRLRVGYDLAPFWWGAKNHLEHRVSASVTLGKHKSLQWGLHSTLAFGQERKVAGGYNEQRLTLGAAVGF